jgi:hypothetical protein
MNRPELAETKDQASPQVSRWEYLAKLAVVSWLQSCLANSEKRSFFARYSPYATTWQIRDDQPWWGQNPLDQGIQIARYFERVKNLPPQILVRTNQYQGQATGLGTYTWGYRKASDTMRVGTLGEAKVPVDLACTSYEDTSTGMLVHFVETALGPQGRGLHGGLILPADHRDRSWCVQLPSTWSTAGPTDTPIGEDRKQRVWTTILSFEVTVEVAVWSEYEAHIEAYQILSNTITVSLPDTLRVGTSVPLTATGYLPPDAWWRVDDNRLAIIRAGSLYAKRIGNLLVSVCAENGTVLAEKSVVIAP